MKRNTEMVAIVVPIHNMEDWSFFLHDNLESIATQTYPHIEVVITDDTGASIVNPRNTYIQQLQNKYQLAISYYVHGNKGMAQNTNEGIKHAMFADFIKILYLDDYLAHPEAIEKMVLACEGDWLICGTDNNPEPHWTDDIETGNNKLGSPSALMMRTPALTGDLEQFCPPLPLFDEKLTWLLDCDYYKILNERWGKPTILNGVHVNIGVGEHQMTHKIPDHRKLAEREYLIEKYA